jgi:hypothetical protein
LKKIRRFLDHASFSKSDGHKRKYRLSKWNIICRQNDQGGLGIEVVEIRNRCQLCKWPFKLLNEEGVWQELLENKYLHSKFLAEVTMKPYMTTLPFWKRLMKVKEEFCEKGSFIIWNSMDRFWMHIEGSTSRRHAIWSRAVAVGRQANDGRSTSYTSASS